MTREEAILCLKGMKDYARDTFTEQTDWQTSLDMAIKALEQESCEDAISRQAVIDILFYKSDNNSEVRLSKELRDRIKSLPPVNPQPKTGHWVRNDNQGVQAVGYLTYHCSECGREICSKYHGKISLLKEYPYCHCGAKMVDPQESEVDNG